MPPMVSHTYPLYSGTPLHSSHIELLISEVLKVLMCHFPRVNPVSDSGLRLCLSSLQKPPTPFHLHPSPKMSYLSLMSIAVIPCA